MGNFAKTDNHDPTAKLDLRRYFLRKYHARKAPRVIDCCQGSGLLWDVLKREFRLASYWGLDVKPKPGRLKLASERVLEQPGWQADVVDVDAYGSPWAHWNALLPNVVQPTTVFLTIGQVMMGVDGRLLRAMGLGRLKIPPALAVRIQEKGVSYLLARSCDHSKIAVEAVEAVSDGSARYIGIHLKPQAPG